MKSKPKRNEKEKLRGWVPNCKMTTFQPGDWPAPAQCPPGHLNGCLKELQLLSSWRFKHEDSHDVTSEGFWTSEGLDPLPKTQRMEWTNAKRLWLQVFRVPA